jgi:ferredoxin
VYYQLDIKLLSQILYSTHFSAMNEYFLKLKSFRRRNELKKMLRQMIKIDEEKCNGCGLCADACHEGAIDIIDGKAKLIRDDYCDGLGNCLPICPTSAISFVQREAAAFDETIVPAKSQSKPENLPCGCPGTQSKTIIRPNAQEVYESNHEALKIIPQYNTSQLNQWPVQIKLVPANAPYFKNAHLLVAADCTAFAHGDFHSFMKNKITVIGCPKLDNIDYSEKLSTILKTNDIKSITVIRMEVPCCGGIVNAVQEALRQSERIIPWSVIVLGTDGTIIED